MSDINGGKRTYLLLLLTTIYLAALMVAGCGGSGGSSGSGGGGGGGGGSGPPDINVSELQVLFGGIVLDHFSDRTISIRNTGSSLLAIGQIAQKKPLSGPFTIINDNCSGYLLAASRTCTFQVRFEPTTQDPFSDTFDIPSNDPDENSVTVRVEGDGRGLKVSINQIDTADCPNGKVNLVVSVTDRNDVPQTGLAQTDFSLFENNVLIGQGAITGFSNQVASPISVALALDNSGSLDWQSLLDLEAAAIAFIQAKDPNDEASIIKFATFVELMQAFTDNEGDLVNAIGRDYCCDTTSTKLYDALWQAIEETADPGRYVRRAIVVFTDGGDRGSVRTLTEVIDRADEEGIPIFTIGLGEVITEILQQLADETGGLYFLAPDSSDLAQIYDNISEILSNQYALEYTSTSSHGATTILDVEVDFNTLQGEDTRDFTGCP